MNKKVLIEQFNETISFYYKSPERFSENHFFESKDGKWSVAENVEHLILSVKPVNMAMKLPKFIPRLLFGKPNRALKSYDEVVAKYQQKLSQGAVATGSYVPKKSKFTQAELIAKFVKNHNELLENIDSWKEEDLDAYLLPHPIIGKLTIREMLYFTLYHIRHHLKALPNY